MKILRIIGVLLSFTYLTVNAQVELVKDINPNGSSIAGSEQLITFKNELYFFAGQDGVANTQLWKSDGTEAGTLLVKDVQAMGFALPRALVKTSEFLYFIAYQSDKFFLFRSDGTSANTNPVLDNQGNLCEINNLIAADDKLFINHKPQGELKFMVYVLYDSGTLPQMLTDPAVYNQSTWFEVYNNKLYFNTSSNVDGVGNELYASDGTVAGTELVKDIFTGSASGRPSSLKVVGTKLFLSADNGSGMEPWLSDGTENGTYQIKDINTGAANSDPNGFSGSTSSKVFFRAVDASLGSEMFVTDGTEIGTNMVKDIYEGSLSSINQNDFIRAASNIFFSAVTSTAGKELWYSDGTEAGTYLVKDINAGSASGIHHSFYDRIWIDNKLYFTAEDGMSGLELYVTDGTESGTRLIEDLHPGSLDSRPTNLTILNGALYFFAQNADGNELRKLALNATDPCDGITCPVGEVCIDGTCYSPKTTGTVIHSATSNPLESVLVNNLNRPSQDITLADGTFRILALPDDTLTFTISGYLSDTIIVEDGATDFQVELTPVEPCTGIACPVGEVCVDGICEDQRCDGVVCEEDEFCEAGICKNLCDGVACPVGQICYEGACYDTKDFGFVYDENIDPLEGVLVEVYVNGNKAGIRTTNQSGRYNLFDLTTPNVTRFSKTNYTTRIITVTGAGRFDVILEKNPCENVSCPMGEVCYYGACYEPSSPIDVSITVTDSIDQPLSDILLEPIGITGGQQVTDVLGKAILSIPDRDRNILLTDISGNYASRIISPSNNDFTVQLSDNLCSAVVCPAGEGCYAGICYPANRLKTFEGYIFDGDSLPLPGALVYDLNDSSTYSNSNGYFSVTLPVNTSNFVFEFGKEGYGRQYLEVTSGELNEIYLSKRDRCKDVICPVGEFCYAGSCYAFIEPEQGLCADIACPVGDICYAGDCYDACAVPEGNFCSENLPDSCDSFSCLAGEICSSGVCYNECVDPSANDQCDESTIDPCENITAPPGYICRGGVIVPECPANPTACAQSSTCDVVLCPPGDVCFTCNDPTGINSSGTSSISGQLNLSGINTGGRILEESNSNVFIYLIETESNRKTAIAKSDASGNFVMQNVPKGTYEIFLTVRGYFMEEMTLDVNEFENIELAFTSNDRFLEMQQSRITSIRGIENRMPRGWFPSPNEGQTFYIAEEGLSSLKIFTLQGVEVQREFSFITDNSGTTLSLQSPLAPGIYVFKWSSRESDQLESQTIFIMR